VFAAEAAGEPRLARDRRGQRRRGLPDAPLSNGAPSKAGVAAPLNASWGFPAARLSRGPLTDPLQSDMLAMCS